MDDEKVVCTYHNIEKKASVYPFSGHFDKTETILPGGTKDSAMILNRQVQNPNDLIGTEIESPLALDTVKRDIEPDLAKIADYFGFDLDQLKREMHQ